MLPDCVQPLWNYITNINERFICHFHLYRPSVPMQFRGMYLLERGDLFPRPMAPSSPEFSLSSPSWSSLVPSLWRPMTTPDTSVWPDCGCSCSADKFSALCHHRNSLASSPGPLEKKHTVTIESQSTQAHAANLEWQVEYKDGWYMNKTSVANKWQPCFPEMRRLNL